MFEKDIQGKTGRVFLQFLAMGEGLLSVALLLVGEFAGAIIMMAGALLMLIISRAYARFGIVDDTIYRRKYFRELVVPMEKVGAILITERKPEGFSVYSRVSKKKKPVVGHVFLLLNLDLSNQLKLRDSYYAGKFIDKKERIFDFSYDFDAVELMLSGKFNGEVYIKESLYDLKKTEFEQLFAKSKFDFSHVFVLDTQSPAEKENIEKEKAEKESTENAEQQAEEAEDSLAEQTEKAEENTKEQLETAKEGKGKLEK